MARDLGIADCRWRVRRERPSRGAHQPAMRARLGEQRPEYPAPVARGLRAQAVPKGVAVSLAGAGALAIAARGRFGNKIVRRFFALPAAPSPPRRARQRCRDDGRKRMGALVLAHPANMGIVSEMGISSGRKILSR